MAEKKILVVEEQANIKNALQFSLESSFNCKLIFCSTIDSARDELRENQDIDIIVCEAELSGEASFDLFRYVASTKRTIDFYVLTREEIEKWPSQDGVEVSGMLSATAAIKPLNDLITKASKADEAPLIEDHLRVTLDSLKVLGGISEDMYIRFKTGRFIQLFSQGDPITQEDLDRYKGKGVEDLYINISGQKWLIDQLDSKMDQLVGFPNAKIKLDKRPRAGGPELGPVPEEHVMGPIKKEAPFAMERKYLKEVHAKMDSMVQLVKKNKNLNRILSSIKIDRELSAYIQTRINLVCHISACLAYKLDWASDATLSRLIYCSHVHDVTLHKYPRLLPFQTLDELDEVEDLTEEERETFKLHPEEVAKIVEMDEQAPPEAYTVILQHHELPGRKGFPHGLSSMKVAPFAALLCISIDFAQHIIETPKWSFPSYIKSAKDNFKGGNFNKVLKALDELAKMKNGKSRAKAPKLKT